MSFSGCPPSLSFDVPVPGCNKWLNESLIYLEESQSIGTVLLGFRLSAYLNGESRDVYWKGFKEIVSRLIEAGKKVYILYPIPELPVHIRTAVMPFSVFGKTPLFDLEKATRANSYFYKNEFVIQKLDSLPYGENLRSVKPFEVLCNGLFCPAVKENHALYFDDNHLSISGARLITESIHLEKN